MIPVVHRYRVVFLALLALVLVYPMLLGVPGGRLILDGFLTVAVVGSCVAASAHRLHWLVSLAFALVVIITRWAHAVTGIESLLFITSIAAAIFFFHMAAVVIVDIIGRVERVTADTIYGALAAYLLLGIGWAFVYLTVELFTPGSYSAANPMWAGDAGELPSFLYYSFVTLTTLGYGDVLPATAQAGTLAVTEAVMGQIYLAVLVARLVGSYIAQKTT